MKQAAHVNGPRPGRAQARLRLGGSYTPLMTDRRASTTVAQSLRHPHHPFRLCRHCPRRYPHCRFPRPHIHPRRPVLCRRLPVLLTVRHRHLSHAIVVGRISTSAPTGRSSSGNSMQLMMARPASASAAHHCHPPCLRRLHLSHANVLGQSVLRARHLQLQAQASLSMLKTMARSASPTAARLHHLRHPRLHHQSHKKSSTSRGPSFVSFLTCQS